MLRTLDRESAIIRNKALIDEMLRLAALLEIPDSGNEVQRTAIANLKGALLSVLRQLRNWHERQLHPEG